MSEPASWERARKPEQIEERRSAILEAARRLLIAGDVKSAGLTAIAREAKLSKANLYRYFESREAILIEILHQEMQAWAEQLSLLLKALPEKGDSTGVAQVLSDSLIERDLFSVLLASVAIDLEGNLSPEGIAETKRRMRACYVGLIDPLIEALPQLSKAQANEFLIMQTMFQMGLWSFANPSPAVAEVMNSEEFADMRMNFIERVRWHSLILLLGLESVAQPRVRPE